MELYKDYSKWDQQLFDYSISLLTNENVFFQKDRLILDYAPDYKKVQKELLNNILKAHLLWIGYGVGVECLAKSILLKHKQLSIEKSQIPVYEKTEKTHFHTYQEAQEYRKNNKPNNIESVYNNIKVHKVIVEDNEWLKGVFKEKGIIYSRQIHTPTLGAIRRKELLKLLQSNVITESEYKMLHDNLKVFIDIRRNVDAHIFLYGRVVGSINSDVENLYLPMINKFINIFYRNIIVET